MRLDDILRLSFNGMSHRGLRSWLTILGVVIGVAAVVGIVSLGQGMQQSISSQLGGLGADIATISAGSNRAMSGGFGMRMEAMSAEEEDTKLTYKDAQIVMTVDGVKVVSGIVSGNAEIEYLSQTATVSVEGVDPLTWSEISSVELESGRALTPGDGNVVVIGYRIANEMFKQPLVINTQVTIEGKSFKIVGILEESGTTGFGSNDNRVFMTIGAARGVLEDIDSDELTSIQVKVEDAGEIDAVIGNITNALMLSRHVTEKTVDFSVTSSQSMQETISDVTGTMTLFLGGIAAVSLIVGAIGIANTMFMSVMERTRQIGTLKALGTTDGEIMKLFLFESGIIGLVGGLFGIFLGFIFSGILSGSGISIMGMGRFGGGSTTVIGLDLVLFAVGFSVVIGIVSGILPARRAAKLQPVEALRYE